MVQGANRSEMGRRNGGSMLNAQGTERALLAALLARLRTLDADVYVGHNISAFDLDVLLHRLQHHKARTSCLQEHPELVCKLSAMLPSMWWMYRMRSTPALKNAALQTHRLTRAIWQLYLLEAHQCLILRNAGGTAAISSAHSHLWTEGLSCSTGRAGATVEQNRPAEALSVSQLGRRRPHIWRRRRRWHDECHSRHVCVFSVSDDWIGLDSDLFFSAVSKTPVSAPGQRG